jgi:alkylated DNA repair dioxygenase AlkB
MMLESLPLIDAELAFIHDFLEPQEADRVLGQLLASIPWRQDAITLYGKQLLQPRLTAWIGDQDSHYSYSGLALVPQPWTPLLLDLKQRIESVAATRFNSVLLNLYRDGNDSVGWHSDDEAGLGPVIASLSLGQSRNFHLRHKRRKDLPLQKIELTHGCLLLMAGATQRNYVHAVPKSAKAMLPRINLTFRTIGG